MTDKHVLIEMSDVSRTFGSGPTAVVAVHGVSCRVTHGQHIALVGPSGSGKSTLLHMMAGLDPPTHGRVSWPAIQPHDLRPGPVGVVFQSANLISTLDAGENVALPLLLAGVPSEAATLRARNAMAAFDVGDLAGALPEELSGGQAQRVAIARATVTEPVLLLADEPTGQLDHTTGNVVMSALLAATAGNGRALVVATHDQAIADRLETVWRLDDGRIADTHPVTCSR